MEGIFGMTETLQAVSIVGQAVIIGILVMQVVYMKRNDRRGENSEAREFVEEIRSVRDE